MSEKKLLFSVTKKDFRIDRFRAGGPGGQNQNKRDTGVRITHLASGAVGESRTARTQGENQKLAFRRLVETEKFKKWHRIETARHLGVYAAVDEQIEKWMAPENIKVEVKQDGRWIDETRAASTHSP